MRVRLTDDPNRFVEVDEVEYFQLVQENKVIPPWDPAKLTKRWPDMSGMYVIAPDVGRGDRHVHIPDEEE